MPLKPVKFKERFDAIKNNPRGIVKYAETLRHRVPELEHVVLRDELATYWYAYYVIKDRWPQGEQQLLKGTNPWGPMAYVLNRYAQNVIKDRWPEAEPFILKDEIEKADYIKHFKIQ